MSTQYGRVAERVQVAFMGIDRGQDFAVDHRRRLVGGASNPTATPAAIISGVVDALGPYGVDDIQMPATPYQIWQAIERHKSGQK